MRAFAQGRAQAPVVEREPARVIGRGRIRVDRDQLEVALVAELHDAIMGRHRPVPAARGQLDAEPAAQVFDALLERRGGDDDVIEPVHAAMVNQPAT